jgi:hypothetical protein
MMQMDHPYYHLVLLHALGDHLRNRLISNSVATPTSMACLFMSLQARVHEMEPVIVSDDDSTDDLDHSDDDIYDPSYEMDPFDISHSIDTIQTHVSKSIPHPVIKGKACANQDKWSIINHKPKDLREQIDDKYKSVKLGYTKSPSSSPFPSNPPSKPPFSLQQSHNINLHEITTYEFLQVHTHELEPDPASDEIVPDDPPVDEAEHEPPEILLINPAEGSHPILNHDSLENKQWGEIPEMESFVDEVSDYEHHIIVQHLTHFQLQDGSLFDDIVDQGVPDAQATEPLQEIDFYDAHEPDLGLPPEDSLTIPTPSGSNILTKCVAGNDNLCARMSGGEITIDKILHFSPKLSLILKIILWRILIQKNKVKWSDIELNRAIRTILELLVN